MIARVRSFLSGIAWLVGWRLARLLPEPLVRAGFEAMSMRSHRTNERRRAVVRRNLEPLVPAADLEATVREAFRWYGRYWAETFRMEDLTSAELTARFTIEGIEHIDKAYAEGKGVVLATPHIGNWDAGGRWVAERYPLVAVAEVLKPRMVFERFIAHRRALGMTIIPLERGTDATGQCLEYLRAGRPVALVADRDLTAAGVPVTMFGRPTSMPAGPAVLSLRSGAPIIAAAIYQREDRNWFARVLPPLPARTADDPDAVRELTQGIAGAFEELIGAAPAQWHMFSRFWTEQ
ncbi:MAG TPA: phosphatidylinositol mannoside acyltransferase [Actinomycetota bacterium]